MIEMRKIFGRDDIIACWLDRQYIVENSGVFKQVVINPYEYAVIIKDGKIRETVTQEKLRGLSGGLMNRLGNWLGGGENFQLVWIDSAEKDIVLPISGRSSDYIDIGKDEFGNVKGKCILRFRIVPDQAEKVPKLMRGRSVLTVADIIDRLGPELTGAIASNFISKYKASEFTENKDVVLKMTDKFIQEIGSVWSDFGIEMISLSIGFGENEYERIMVLAARTELRQKEMDIKFAEQIGNKGREERLKRELESFEHDTKKQFEQHGYDFKKLEMEHRQDLERITDEYDRGKEYSKVLHDEKIKTTHLEKELQRMEMQFGLEDKRWGEELERTKKLREERLQEAFVGIRIKEKDWELTEKKLDASVRARAELVKQDIGKYQATELERSKIDAQIKIEEAKARAEEKKYEIETYRQGRKEAEQQELARGELIVRTVEAAKQGTPTTLVQGSSQPIVGLQISTESPGSKKKKTDEKNEKSDPA